MTNPLDVPKSYPGSPTLPSASPEGYVTPQTVGRRKSTPMTSAEVEAMRKQFLDLLLQRVVEALVGAFIPGAGDAFDQLQNWADQLGLGGVADLIQGLLDGTLPVNVASLFGQLAARLFSNVPKGAVSGDQPNLLPDGTFAPGSITVNPIWSVDTTSTRTGDGSGSAKVIADGTTKALRSGRTPSDVIPVGSGQTFTGSVFVSHEGYDGSGIAVLLQVVPYAGSTAGAPEPLTNATVAPGGGSTPVEILVPATYSPEGADLDWPGHELSGTYAVPDGVTGVQLRYVVTSAAQAGTFRFDDPSGIQTGQVRQEWVDGLPDALQDLLARFQLLVDTAFKALTGAETVAHTLEDLFGALLHIPTGNVDGVNGPSNIGASILAFINALVGGMVGTPADPDGDGASNEDAFNIAKIISARASQGSNAWEVLGYRNNTPVDNGMLPSSEANYNITVVNTTLSTTQSVSLIGVIRVQRSAPLGVVSWLGCGTTGITAFYINIWQIDPTTGDWALVHHSPDIKANLVAGTTPGWNFYELATPLARLAGEDYAYELVPVGGTHSVRGFSTADTIPDHPYAQVVALAAKRDNTSSPNSPPSTIAKASVVRSGNIPWIETAIDTGNDSDQHDPITVYLTADNTVPIPAWANFIDRVAVGAGGGARKGQAPGFFGASGEPGRFNADTLQRNIDFDSSDTSVVFTRGAGGTHGSTAGTAGGDSTLTVGDSDLVAEGGAGGTALKFGSGQIGRGPGQLDYNDEPYVGGGDQNTAGSNGAAPGGAATGGNGFGLQNGGDGAPGAGWVRFRQDPIVGESFDITPPTAPTTLTLDVATFSTLTVTASGATDA